MTTMKKLAKSKVHREAFVASQVEIGIPFQIRALRKQRDMGQKELALATGMQQPRISAIECPGYTGYTIETLSRIAAAFDVALIVRFGSFSELVKLSNDFLPDEFEIPSFDDEVISTSTQEEQTSTKSFAMIKTTYSTAEVYQQTSDYAFDLSGETVLIAGLAQVSERRGADRPSAIPQLIHRGNSNVRTGKTYR